MHEPRETPPTYTAITLGAVAQRIMAGGFVLSECVHPPNLVLPRHAHAPATVCFLIDGSYGESFRRDDTDCRAGTLVGKCAGATHANRVGPQGARSLTLELVAERRALLDDAAHVLDEPFIVHSGPAVSVAWRLAQELRRADSFAPLAVEGLGLELFAALSRARAEPKSTPAPRWLATVRAALHDSPATSWTLAQLAALADVHPVHLARQFRKHVGCSVGTYARRLRVEAARARLLHSNEALIQIALALGYADQSHFTREFRQATGLTPAAFRDAARR